MTWDDTKQNDTGGAVDADEQLTAPEWNGMVREIKSGRYADWVVYKDSGGTWHAEGPDGATETSGTDPAAVLQHAADQSEGNSIYLASSIESGEALSSTVVISKSFIGPGVRNQGHIYVGAADPGLRFEGEGTYERMWLRGQGNANDLVVFRDCGRGTVIRDIQCFNTDGNGMVTQGVQQATIENVTFATCGDPANDTAELRLDDSPTDSLETNACNIVGYHSHGSADPQGTCIQMRRSNGGVDFPRNLHISHVNIENGPSSGVPVIEVAGRNQHFENGRIMGIDDANTVFQTLAGPRETTVSGFTIVAETGGGCHGFTNADATAPGSFDGGQQPYRISDCVIQVDGTGIYLEEYNQANNSLQVDQVTFPGRAGSTQAIDVSASKDATPAVILSNIEGGGQEIRVQGARLSVSGITDATYNTAFTDEFGPHIISDDGSFEVLHGLTDSTDASGVTVFDFKDTCQFPKGAAIDARVQEAGAYILESNLLDNSGDGTADRVEVTVYDDAGSTVGSGAATVELDVWPHS